MLFPSFYLIMWFIWKFWGELKGCMAAGKKTNVQEVMERSNTNIVIFLHILQIENNNSLLADKKISFASYFCAFLRERVRERENYIQECCHIWLGGSELKRAENDGEQTCEFNSGRFDLLPWPASAPTFAPSLKTSIIHGTGSRTGQPHFPPLTGTTEEHLLSSPSGQRGAAGAGDISSAHLSTEVALLIHKLHTLYFPLFFGEGGVRQ